MAKKWMGDQHSCDFCGDYLLDKDFFVDGKTRQGPWALMCPNCWTQYGVGKFGVGLAQKYDGKTLEKLV